MHAADEFAAFLKLRQEGKTDSQIASRMGVSLLTVQRRMKLAEVSPRFVQMLRAGQIDMEQIAALSIESSHEKQEAVWDALPQWQRSAYHLKEAITQSELSSNDKLARFVGVDAYRAAGGTIREDLFSEQGEFWLQDRELLMRLVVERMETVEQGERAAGWSWVETVDSLYSSGYYNCTHEKPKSTLTEEEAEGLAELEYFIENASLRQRDLIAAFNAECDQHGDEHEQYSISDVGEDESELPTQKAKDLRAEWAGLEQDIDNVRELAREARDSATQWTEKQLSSCGVMLHLNSKGQLEIHRGLRRPVDKKALVKQLKAEGKPIPKTLQGEVKERAAHSERLMNDMTAHRTAALKAALIDSPHVALALVVHRLYLSMQHGYENSPLKLSLTIRSADSLANLASEFPDSPAAQAIERATQHWGDVLPGGDRSATTLQWFVGQDDASLLDMLAFLSSLGIDDIHGREREGYQSSDALADALDLDMADWWKPTPGTYLNAVSKTQLIEAVTEQRGAEAAKVMASHKKGDAVAYAAGQLADTRWLPVPLRRKQAPQ